MARIAGINLPKDKRIVIALTYVYGIGPKSSEKILNEAGIDQSIRTKDLSSDQEHAIRMIVDKQYMTEGDLRRDVRGNVKRLRDIKAYRGIRHAKRLPARGQRTKTNNRTIRGNKRTTMGSGRAKAASKT